LTTKSAAYKTAVTVSLLFLTPPESGLQNGYNLLSPLSGEKKKKQNEKRMNKNPAQKKTDQKSELQKF
jgi:hypothetical protein